MMKGILLLFVLFLFTQNIFSQGKIFTKDEADKLFGPVLTKVDFSFADFQSIVHRTGKFLRFKFSKGKLHIYDTIKQEMLPNTEYSQITKEEPVHIYDVSVVHELLSKGNNSLKKASDYSDSIVSLEQRESVVSVTYGDYTMEVAWNCPPLCGE